MQQISLQLALFCLVVLMPTILSLRSAAHISSWRRQFIVSAESDPTNENIDNRKQLWKSISGLEKEAVSLIVSGTEEKITEAFKLFSKSIIMKKSDPFIQLAEAFNEASEKNDKQEMSRLLSAMHSVGLPPHLSSLVANNSKKLDGQLLHTIDDDDVDPGSNFSDTVTEQIRVKVNAFYDKEKSDPPSGKYMFWYKVAIYNEGSEPVQIVARMWEIEKCRGEKEIIRGAGIMSTQPIIPPGDVYTYSSVCPLKVFPPKGKRVIGSMSGAYTMCKGNMGQNNFTVKVGGFKLILPEDVASTTYN